MLFLPWNRRILPLEGCLTSTGLLYDVLLEKTQVLLHDDDGMSVRLMSGCQWRYHRMQNVIKGDRNAVQTIVPQGVTINKT